MIRKTFLKAAALALGLVSLGWISAAAAVQSPCFSGKTKGAWDLPTTVSNGFAKGELFDSSGIKIFDMKAVLVEMPSPALSVRVGTLSGELHTPFSAGIYPKYLVFGDWKSDLAGNGVFSASIAKQRSPLGPVILIGKMAGKFVDSPLCPAISCVGKYEGEWKACL